MKTVNSSVRSHGRNLVGRAVSFRRPTVVMSQLAVTGLVVTALCTLASVSDRRAEMYAGRVVEMRRCCCDDAERCFTLSARPTQSSFQMYGLRNIPGIVPTPFPLLPDPPFLPSPLFGCVKEALSSSSQGTRVRFTVLTRAYFICLLWLSEINYVCMYVVCMYFVFHNVIIVIHLTTFSDQYKQERFWKRSDYVH